MIELILISLFGFLGVSLLAFCGLPQMIQVFRQKHAEGVNVDFIYMWFWGEVFLLLYVLGTTVDLLLICNYVLNIVIVSVIIYYIWFPSRKG